MKTIVSILMIVMLMSSFVGAQASPLVYDEEYPIGSIIGDSVGASPELAPRGEYAIGVRTIEIVNKDQVDLAAITEENPRPLYDRALTVEVWYPAVVEEGVRQLSTYTDYIGRIDQDNLEAFDYLGRAVRDAEPNFEEGPYPVIIVTHGYPGSRYLMSNLGENLATKGYVVFSIAHADNTYLDYDPSISLASAVINRTLDQRFMISSLEPLNAEGWLAGAMDTERVGMIGYSFGGFGLLRTLGVTFGDWTKENFAPYLDLITEEEGYEGDKRVDAAVLFAPYGSGWFDTASYANISVPTLWIQGDYDSTVPYAPVHEIFDQAVNTDRYFLTYELLNHKVAPNPAPVASQKYVYADGARRWQDATWDQWIINGINFHFITAFMDAQLKGETEKMEYLNVKEPVGKNAVYSVDENGEFTEAHTYWPGFYDGTAIGLTLEHLSAE